jgi:amino acid permease
VKYLLAFVSSAQTVRMFFVNRKYVGDPALGFCVGWNYWAQWAICLPAELAAGGLIMQFWLPDVQPFIWAICFIVPLSLVNCLGVKVIT